MLRQPLLKVHCCILSLSRLCTFFHIKKIQVIQHARLAFLQCGLGAGCEMRFIPYSGSRLTWHQDSQSVGQMGQTCRLHP